MSAAREWPAGAEQLRQRWRRTRREIEGFAESVHRQQRDANPTSRQDYENHFVNVVCARIVLEPMAAPAALRHGACAALRISPSHVARLERSGCCVLSGVLASAGVDAEASA